MSARPEPNARHCGRSCKRASAAYRRLSSNASPRPMRTNWMHSLAAQLASRAPTSFSRKLIIATPRRALASYYPDTSVLAKHYAHEPGTGCMTTLGAPIQGHALYAVHLVSPEPRQLAVASLRPTRRALPGA